MKNKKTWLAVGAVVLAAALMVGAWFAFGPQATAGEKDIIVVVKYADGTTERHEVSTDAEYLREAAGEVLTLEGEMGPYGFTLYSVNGVVADFSKDSSYWAVYVDGEYGQYGLDAQPVADGVEYTFAYEKY